MLNIIVKTLTVRGDVPAGLLENPLHWAAKNHQTAPLAAWSIMDQVVQVSEPVTLEKFVQPGNYCGESHAWNQLKYGYPDMIDYDRSTSDGYIGVYVTEWAYWKHVQPQDSWQENPHRYHTSPFDPHVLDDAKWNGLGQSTATHLLFGFLPICIGGDDDSKKYQMALCTVNPCDQYVQKAQEGGAGRNPLMNLLVSCDAKEQDWEVTIFDTWLDVTVQFCQLAQYKIFSPDTKVIMSIGGWTLSKPFHMLKTDEQIGRFSKSVAKFAVMYPFIDGFDLDYENPEDGGADDGSTLMWAPVDIHGHQTGSPVGPSTHPTTKLEQVTVEKLGKKEDWTNYLSTVKALRNQLDDLSTKLGRDKYELSIAVNCDLRKLRTANYGDMVPYLDGINMMTYDFSGAWATGTDLSSKDDIITHQANLYPNEAKTTMTSVDEAVQAITGMGVPSTMLAVGVAFYGRGWSNVDTAGVDSQYLDDEGNVKQGKDWFDGTTTAKNMPQPGCSGVVQPGVVDYTCIADAYDNYQGAGKDNIVCEYFYDDCAQAPEIMCKGGVLLGTELYTYDNPRSVFAKGRYVKDNQLKGLFAWAMDQDDGTLINAMNEAMGYKPLSGSGMFDGNKFPKYTGDGCGKHPRPGPTPSADPVAVYVKQCGLMKDVGTTINCTGSLAEQTTFTANKAWVDACNMWYPKLIASSTGFPADCDEAIANFKANHKWNCDCGLVG